MNLKSFFCSCALCAILCVEAQDPFLPNTSQSLLNLNSSFAGSNGLLRSQHTYQIQDRELRTHFHSVDGYVNPLRGGVALMYRNDLYRDYLSTLSISLAYARHIKVGDGDFQIRPSVQLSYFEKNIDWNKIQINSVRNNF